ncbi:MAG: hypothetical protein ACI8TQ_000281 [Planctomycetota bacterium]|jgi:hypothetical protein
MLATDSPSKSPLPWRNSYLTGALIGGLCLLTYLLKQEVAAGREHPGHGDVSHYFALARGLAEGRGMWMQRIATWLSSPDGLPVYGAGYWMPMPAWIARFGMLVSGDVSFYAAGQGMLILTSIVPCLVYLLGRDLFDNARLGLAGAVLATSFHLFLDKSTLPLTHGAALVFGGFTLWSIVRSESNRHFLWLAGALIALSQLNRSDGVLWIPALLCAHLFSTNKPTNLRQLTPAFVAYLLALSPFLAANWLALGRLWPASLLDVALLPSYSSLYALPETLSLDSYLAPGFATILSQKFNVAGTNALTFLTGMASSGRIGAASNLLSYAPHLMVLLAWLGARPLFTRRCLPLWVFLLCEWLLYSFVFTHTGHTSFESILYAIYPVFVLLSARGLWILCAGIKAPFFAGSVLRKLVFTAVCGFLCFANFSEAQFTSTKRVLANQRLYDLNQAQFQRLFRRNRLTKEVVMVSPSIIHSLHAHTKLSTVAIPTFASADEIWQAGKRVGATHLLIKEVPVTPGRRNVSALIKSSERFKLVDQVHLNQADRKLYALTAGNSPK